MTQLTNNQVKQFRTDYIDPDGQPCVLIASISHDDRCKNGHNSFSITGHLYDRPTICRGIVHKNGKRLLLGSCGCLHTVIAEHFPELAKYIKWHLVSTDGPMHYIANSMYHAKEILKEQGKYYAYLKEPTTGSEKFLKIVYGARARLPNLEYARASAVWPEAELEDFTEEKLKARLPALMLEFRNDIEELGFTY